MGQFQLKTFTAGPFVGLEETAPFPCDTWAIADELPNQIVHEPSSLFGYVYSGTFNFSGTGPQSPSVKLTAGMYFSVLSHDWNFRPQGQCLVIRSKGMKVLNQFGGPIENQGRLKYINGCTDSLLIPPVKKGDACLNLLVFPPHIQQTPHLHPSFRLGMVVRGAGHCLTEGQSHELRPGQIFMIPANLQHSFNSGKEGLSVIAFHPDSDWGPTDEIHPMINRTWIESES